MIRIKMGRDFDEGKAFTSTKQMLRSHPIIFSRIY